MTTDERLTAEAIELVRYVARGEHDYVFIVQSSDEDAPPFAVVSAMREHVRETILALIEEREGGLRCCHVCGSDAYTRVPDVETSNELINRLWAQLYDTDIGAGDPPVHQATVEVGNVDMVRLLRFALQADTLRAENERLRKSADINRVVLAGAVMALGELLEPVKPSGGDQ